MAREMKQSVQVEQEPGYEARRRVIENGPSGRTVFVSRFSKFMWLLAGVIVVLLSLRFVLLALAANATAGFAQLVYNVTDVFMLPFANLVASTSLGEGAGILEWSALIAIVVYLLAAWAIIALFRIIFAETRRSRSVTTVERS